MAVHRCIVTILALGCADPTPDPPPEEAPVTAPEAAPATAQPALIQRPSGTCALVQPKACPEGARCNPPPPKPVPCPALSPTALVRVDDGCEQRGPWRCDEGVTCEQQGRLAAECPPLLADAAPDSQITQHHLYGCTLQPAGGDRTPVLCPPGMERPPAPNVSIVAGSDGLCLAKRPVSCPPHVSCNPPVPQPVICPPDLR